jgi:hypothetical protein
MAVSKGGQRRPYSRIAFRFVSPSNGFAVDKRTRRGSVNGGDVARTNSASLETSNAVYYLYNTQRSEEDDMEFIRNIQARDWVIAAVAFVAGAFIF